MPIYHAEEKNEIAKELGYQDFLSAIAPEYARYQSMAPVARLFKVTVPAIAYQLKAQKIRTNLGRDVAPGYLRNAKVKNRTAWGLGYPSYDAAILYMYYVLEWPLPPIANAFHVSVITIKNRIVNYHKRKMRPKGGSRKGGQRGGQTERVIVKAIPVKSFKMRALRKEFEEKEARETSERSGNSIWYKPKDKP